MRRAFLLYMPLAGNREKIGPMRAYASKSRAEYEGPMGCIHRAFLPRFLINEKGQGALEMRRNDRPKPGSALLKRVLRAL